MAKRIFKYLPVFLLVFVLFGCSQQQNNTTSTSKTENEIPSLIPDWVNTLLSKASLADEGFGAIQIKYPLNDAMFPPEIVAPTFMWVDANTNANCWVIAFADGTNTICKLSAEAFFRPDKATWEVVKKSGNAPTISLFGFNKANPQKPLTSGSVRIQISNDRVDAPIFYREVILPFIDAVIDPSKLRWRYGAVDSEEQPPIVLEGLPVCGNCHSFSADGSLLAMDVDYANSKGSYVITRLAQEMTFNSSDIITWNDYKKNDGEQTFGLLSQISPDGRYVLSTVKDKSVFVPMDGLYYSQLFFPLKGIIACYDRVEDKFTALEGASDPAFCQSNPTWSPDGKTVLFAKTETYNLQNTQGQGKTLLTRAECKEFVEDGKPFQYQIHRLTFTDGHGSESSPLPGACEEGVSNYFPKYSPDGKWIVFCKSASYMLLRGDSKLYIMPNPDLPEDQLPAGWKHGEPRLMRCNTSEMNSWHSWSPNSKWLVFSSKENGPYTQLWLTHIDENGESTPPVVLEQFTAADRAANIPEFVNNTPDAVKKIQPNFLDDISMCRAGDEYYRNGKTEPAIEKYQEALKINPNCYQAHQKLGFLYYNVIALREKDAIKSASIKEEGLRHTSIALKLEPRYAMTQYDFGIANLGMGNYESAKMHIHEAIRLVPRGIDLQYDASDMRFQLGRAYLFSGGIDEAIGWMKQAVEINPKNARAAYLLASVYASQQQFDQASIYMQSAIATNPKVDVNPDIHARFAAHYATEQQYEQALEHAQRALQLADAQGKDNISQEMREVIPQLQRLLAP